MSVEPLPLASPVAGTVQPARLRTRVIFGLLTFWVFAWVVASALTTWIVREIARAENLPWFWYIDPLFALIQAAAIAIPAGLFAYLVRAPRLRAAAATWTAAACVIAILGLSRGIPESWLQLALLIQALFSLVGAVLLHRFNARSRVQSASGVNLEPFTVALALILAVPWLAQGALGSLLDTLLAGAVAAGFGLLLGEILDWQLLAKLRNLPADRFGERAFIGLAISITALIVAVGTGYGGINVLLLATLLPLGGVVTVLVQSAAHHARRVLAIFFAAVVAAPLALFSAQDLSIYLAADDAVPLALITMGYAVGLGALLSLLHLFNPPVQHFARQPVATILLLGAAFVAVGSYVTLGRPGWYGNQVFVVLNDQVDLSAATTIADREERVRFVYTTLTNHANQTQAELRSDLERFGINYTPYYLVNGIEVNGGPLLRAYLAQRPEVDRVLLSRQVRPLPAPPPAQPGSATKPEGVLWNISMIGADRVWEEFGIDGSGIVIGLSDSGVDASHPDLAAGYRGADGTHAYNWFDPWYATDAPRDYGSHGSQTLSSAVGSNGVGVAPGATWFACSNLARNMGNPARYLDCMQFMLAPHAPNSDPFTSGDPARAAHVVNNSWGCPPEQGCDAAALLPAVQALRSAGILSVAGAGNAGDQCSSVSDPLPIYAEVIAVGAIDADGVIAPFSSRGPVTVDGSGRTKPDLVAPGVAIISAAPDGTYSSGSGTSMAGPHIAGVIALIWSANPALIGDLATTEQILRDTAAPYAGGEVVVCAGTDPGSNIYGAGMVDAYAAVKAALSLR